MTDRAGAAVQWSEVLESEKIGKKEMHKTPRIGVAVVVRKAGAVLLGKRKNAHGSGHWAFPGGHLEMNESIESCAIREVYEETGLRIRDLRRGPYTSDRFDEEGKHYVTLFVLAEYDSGRLVAREPEKCDSWIWFSLKRLPEPLFLSIRNLRRLARETMRNQDPSWKAVLSELADTFPAEE